LPPPLPLAPPLPPPLPLAPPPPWPLGAALPSIGMPPAAHPAHANPTSMARYDCRIAATYHIWSRDSMPRSTGEPEEVAVEAHAGGERAALEQHVADRPGRHDRILRPGVGRDLRRAERSAVLLDAPPVAVEILDVEAVGADAEAGGVLARRRGHLHDAV